ncbi:MAG TPA: hypothetical protein VMM57_12495 [Bacteroidota bacterium]|nr:hypothetical protein [Bacteroidota bacterium]
MSGPASQKHFFDLKIPLGGLLVGYGIVLGVYGLVTSPDDYAKSLGINLNLIWGILLFAIGGLFLAAIFRRK